VEIFINRKEIAAMEQVYLGIDVGNSFSTVVALNEEQEPTYMEQIPTLDVAKWIELVGLFEGCEIHAAFEIGTHYGWLSELLNKYCVRVEVVNAEAFAVISKSTKKTDSIDAVKLAQGLWRGDLPTVTVPNERIRQDRRLVAHMHHHSNNISRAKILIRSILLRARLECPHTNVMGAAAQEWLTTFAMPKLEAQEQMFLRMLMEQLTLLLKQSSEMNAGVPARMEAYPEAPIVQSIPGFGPLVSLALLSIIAGIGRFKTPGELASYLGLCGSVDQSGQSLRQGSITRRGSSHVRWLLAQAITHLIRKDPKAKRRYEKLRRKKKAKVARVAMMRWLVTVLWRMLNNQEKYRLDGKKGNYFKRKSGKAA